MKKIVLLVLVMCFVSVNAFAQGQESDGSLLTLSSPTGGFNDLVIGLSNQVQAVYYNDGSQWFSIGTAHKGGTRIYATAQDITNIYSAIKSPGEDADWNGMATGQDESDTWQTGWTAL